MQTATMDGAGPSPADTAREDRLGSVDRWVVDAFTRRVSDWEADNAAAPGLRGVLGGLAGLALVSTLGTVGFVAAEDLGRMAVSVPLVALGSAVLTLPSLAVLAPFCGLKLGMDDALNAVRVSLGRTGRVALAGVPFVAFWAATTELSALVSLAMVWMLGLVSVRALLRSVWASEWRAGADGPRRPEVMLWRGLCLAAWCGLHAMVGLRLWWQLTPEITFFGGGW